MWSFKKMTEEEEDEAYRLEEIPSVVELVQRFWIERWPCTDIRILPDMLEEEGISWKYYFSGAAPMHAMKMVRHVRFGPMWERIVPASDFKKDLAEGRSLACPG